MSDLKPLPPELLALLDAERDAPGAPAGSRDRVRARLAVSIGAGAVGAATAANATPALGTAAARAAPQVAGKLLLAKIGIGIVAVVGVGVGVRVATRPKPALVQPASASVNANANANVNANANANVNANANANANVPSPAGAPAIPPTRAVRSEREPSRRRESQSDLTAERTLVDTARQSLASGDAQGALAALGRHASRYPAGQLAEERDGLRIRALAAAGRSDETRSRAAEFRRAHPHSIFLPAVDATLRALPAR